MSVKDSIKKAFAHLQPHLTEDQRMAVRSRPCPSGVDNQQYLETDRLITSAVGGGNRSWQEC